MSDPSEPNEAAALLGPEVMKEYRDDCAAQLAALEKFPSDLELVRLTAHRLSGSAGTYGYAEASRLAARLERRVLDAKAGGPDPEASELRAAFQDLRRALSLPE